MNIKRLSKKNFLGSGYQYAVYDLGNGRVIKYKHSTAKFVVKRILQILARAHKVFYFRPDRTVVKLSRIHVRFKSCYEESITGLIKKAPILPWDLFGHPTIFQSYNYEQDKVTPLSYFFRNGTSKLQKLIVDRYISFTFRLWGFGVADYSFNMTENYGQNEKMEIILMDLGELTFDKDRIAQSVKARHWSDSSCYKKLDCEIRNYYLNKMRENLTIENLNKHWRRSKKEEAVFA